VILKSSIVNSAIGFRRSAWIVLTR
jgi:hypothetical protein